MDFDKFVMLVARLWDALYVTTAEEVMAAIQQDTLPTDNPISTTFPCPFVELPGKHGPGRAVYDGVSAPSYIVSVLFLLQQEEVLHYFNVITPPRDRHETTDQYYQRIAHDLRTTVEASIPVLDAQSFLEDFTSHEVAVVLDLQRSLRRLTPAQIRALGTHEDFEKTRKYAIKELEYLDRERVFVKLTASIAAGHVDATEVRLLVEYADEICRKSDENRSDYESGWRLLDGEFQDVALRSAFRSVQQSHDVVWPNDAHSALIRGGRQLRAMGQYLKTLAKIQGRPKPDGGALKAAEESLHKRVVEIVNTGLAAVPTSLSALFTDDGNTLHENVRHQLVSMVEGARTACTVPTQ